MTTATTADPLATLACKIIRDNVSGLLLADPADDVVAQWILNVANNPSEELGDLPERASGDWTPSIDVEAGDRLGSRLGLRAARALLRLAVAVSLHRSQANRSEEELAIDALREEMVLGDAYTNQRIDLGREIFDYIRQCGSAFCGAAMARHGLV